MKFISVVRAIKNWIFVEVTGKRLERGPDWRMDDVFKQNSVKLISLMFSSGNQIGNGKGSL